MTTWDKVAFFRAKRSGLIEGFPSPEEAASAILGAQAQIEAPARWALALRTQNIPTASEIKDKLLVEKTLVRAWGQRDTVHMYATDDWHLFAKAQSLWPASARRGAMPTDEELADFIGTIEGLDGAFTRTHLLEAAPPRLVQAFVDEPQNNDPPERMAITRLIWVAGREGFLSSTENIGREQGYVSRKKWVPGAKWPDITPEDAAIEVVRRYLKTWGPARVQDIAHFLGARITDTRRWVEPIRDQLVELEIEGLGGHLMFKEDAECLQATPDSWPARLLPAYDTQMMTHANKEPLLKNSDDQPRVWAKSAVVKPTIFFKGQFVAVWSHKATKRAVSLDFEPLTGVDGGVGREIKEALKRDGAELERHLLSL